MKKITITLILLTAFIDCGLSKQAGKTESSSGNQQIRVYVNGENRLPSSEEIDNLLNKKIPSILEKISGTGVDPLKIFVKTGN